VETHDDRTLFFDLLPVFFHTASGFKVKVKLFTVPGQVIHNATRRIVLQNADAVAFIADSRRSMAGENNAYWKNLQENMRENGLDASQVPVVIQYNKLDLPEAKTAAEIDETRKKGKEKVIGAVAIRGEGCWRRCTRFRRRTAPSTGGLTWAGISALRGGFPDLHQRGHPRQRAGGEVLRPGRRRPRRPGRPARPGPA
jgi:hypothetical protein